MFKIVIRELFFKKHFAKALLFVAIFVLAIKCVNGYLRIQEYGRMVSNEESDFLIPLSVAIQKYKQEHQSLPRGQDQTVDLLKRYGISARWRYGLLDSSELIWLKNGCWVLLDGSRYQVICFIFNKNNRFYTPSIVSNASGDVESAIIPNRVFTVSTNEHIKRREYLGSLD